MDAERSASEQESDIHSVYSDDEQDWDAGSSALAGARSGEARIERPASASRTRFYPPSFQPDQPPPSRPWSPSSAPVAGPSMDAPPGPLVSSGSGGSFFKRRLPSQNRSPARPRSASYSDSRVARSPSYSSRTSAGRVASSSIAQGHGKTTAELGKPAWNPAENALPVADMYEHIQFLKLRVHQLDQYNVSLRTRIQRANMEARKKEKQIQELSDPRTAVNGPNQYGQFKEQPTLVGNLKKIVKQLKKTIELKEIKVHELRDSSRYTRVVEMELQRRTYSNEIQRLQRLLMAFSEDAAMAHSLSQKQLLLQERNYQLKTSYATLRQDYQDIVTRLNEARAQLVREPPVDLFATVPRPPSQKSDRPDAKDRGRPRPAIG